MRANRPCTFRVSASTSGDSTRTSRSAENSPSRYGLDVDLVVEVHALEALHEDAQGAVGDLDQLVDDGDRSDAVDVVEARASIERPRRDQRDEPVAGDHVVDHANRPLLADRERRHRLREDHRVLERQDRQHRRQRHLIAVCPPHVEQLAHASPGVIVVHLDRHVPERGALGDRQVHGQHTVLEARRRALRLDVLGELHLTLEGAVLDLHLLVHAARCRGRRRSPATTSRRSPATTRTLSGSTPGSSIDDRQRVRFVGVEAVDVRGGSRAAAPRSAARARGRRTAARSPPAACRRRGGSWP